MKRFACFVLFLIIIGSVSLATSENVTALLNKEITIKYCHDDSNNSYTLLPEGYYEYSVLSNFITENYRFYAKGENDSEDFHYKNEVFPISYEGTTYLPVRSVSGLLWTGIIWDGDTNSVKIGEGNRDWQAIDKEDEYDEKNKGVSQYIEVLRNEDVKIYYNGKLQTFKDANGKIVYPLSYNGTTYLPIRACANLFNMLIDWDADTNSVILTKKSDKQVFADLESDKLIKIGLPYYTDEELEILLNSFFAKYGHDFDTQRLEDYFMLMSWYKKVDGKKVATNELTKREQQIVTQIKNEVERRKSLKDINTLSNTNRSNNRVYRTADVLNDSNGDYVKLFDSAQESLKAKYTNSIIDKVELLPSKVYLMNDKIKFYYNYNGETYFVPVEKVNSKDQEKIVLMDNEIEIYNNGDLVINGTVNKDFYDVTLFELDNYAGWYSFEGWYRNAKVDLITYLLSNSPKRPSDEPNAIIGYRYNFDNDKNTNEYVFTVPNEGFEGGASYLYTDKKYILLDKDSRVYQIEQFGDIDFDTNILGYSNLFKKGTNWSFDASFDDSYQIKYYAISELSTYVAEDFIDAYYLFIPNKGFILVHRDLAGNEINIDNYIFTIKNDLKLYSIEKYGEVYIRDYINPDDYDKFWLIYNEPDDEDDEQKNAEYNTKILKKGSKVKVIGAEGWWFIAFKSEDGKEAYYIYYTPAGVT